MTERRKWNRDDLLIAFYLYNQTPFGKISHRNQEIVRVAEQLHRTPSSLSMKMANIASCDPIITESGRSGLKGASKADRDMWLEMSENWELFYVKSSEAYLKLMHNSENEVIDENSYIGQERTAQIKCRVGQAQFRKIVLSSYNGKCCISGLENSKLLVASHIIPWSEKPSERLNPSNGLCLSSIHDKAFDQGLITLNSHLEVVLSSELLNQNQPFSELCFEKFEGKAITLPTKFIPKEKFLMHHRKEIFKN